MEKVKQQENKKIKDKKPKENKIKRWFYGLGKEFSRTTWPSVGKIFQHLIIVILITVILALIFLGFDLIVPHA